MKGEFLKASCGNRKNTWITHKFMFMIICLFMCSCSTKRSTTISINFYVPKIKIKVKKKQLLLKFIHYLEYMFNCLENLSDLNESHLDQTKSSIEAKCWIWLLAWHYKFSFKFSEFRQCLTLLRLPKIYQIQDSSTTDKQIKCLINQNWVLSRLDTYTTKAPFHCFYALLRFCRAMEFFAVL